MPMLAIEGHYRILRAMPDGDSARFYPNNPDDWKQLSGPYKVSPNRAGGVQTRFDGIDALETHYGTRGGVFGTTHQPLKFGHLAAREVLTWLGFTDVVRSANETVTECEPMEVPGYLLTRSVDKYGRCVAFLFKGKAPVASGTPMYFGREELQKSLNYHLLQQGLVYPTYYTKLYWDIRQEMTKAVKQARPGKGLWPEDKTLGGFDVRSPQTIFDDAVILPKLFRRLVDYLALNDGDSSLEGFGNYLASRDDRLFILSTGHATGFDYVVDIQGQNVKLTYPPEDLVFVEA